MTHYLITSVLMAIAVYLAYVQGHINGKQEGINQAIEEDLIRLDRMIITDDKEVDMVNHMLAEDNAELSSAILDSIEAPTEQPY